MALVAILVLVAMPASAGVTVSVYRADHIVAGATAVQLVRSMNASPVHGDHGSAYASIHPDYALKVDTREAGGMCRADVDVSIHFQLTLPVAASPGGMSRGTHAAWNGFVTFARNHEAHHQASYTACARSFAAKASHMSGGQCFALSADIQRAFSQMKRDCEAQQRGFDIAQARILPRLSLFAMARMQRRR